MAKITQKLVKELFYYDPIKGQLIWKIDRGSNKTFGLPAGCLQNKGYLVTKINKVSYLNHRLIWLYHYGELPKMLDHINGVRLDNRLENLRKSDYKLNSLNRKGHRENTFKYFYCYKLGNRYYAYYRENSEHKYLGGFNTEEEARIAYNNR